MSELMAKMSAAIGLDRDASALTFTQISLRGIIVFIATLVIVRCPTDVFYLRRLRLMQSSVLS